ncbi:collagen alpha-1(I) chain-like [Tachyglossus aculeatus]|uniref:collagen alpha-1(I) chain-like n=1 Tax=Tachyglossus aculeatus TaxID=9261 RepID=UPI0018F65A47|nr:collagen alpha-1(I) chain-like [Tachyglossus aculeatus]
MLAFGQLRGPASPAATRPRPGPPGGARRQPGPPPRPLVSPHSRQGWAVPGGAESGKLDQESGTPAAPRPGTPSPALGTVGRLGRISRPPPRSRGRGGVAGGEAGHGRGATFRNSVTRERSRQQLDPRGRGFRAVTLTGKDSRGPPRKCTARRRPAGRAEYKIHLMIQILLDFPGAGDRHPEHRGHEERGDPRLSPSLDSARTADANHLPVDAGGPGSEAFGNPLASVGPADPALPGLPPFSASPRDPAAPAR